MSVGKKIDYFAFRNIVFYALLTPVASATSRYVYNGNQSSGWQGYGTFYFGD